VEQPRRAPAANTRTGRPSLKTDPRRMLIGFAVAASLVVAPQAAASAPGATDAEIDTRPNSTLDHPARSSDLRAATDLRQGDADNSDAENDNGAARASGPSHAVGSDQDFLTAVASGSATEIEAGRLAQDRASNSDVRQFGDRLARDHQEQLRAATNIAQSKRFRVPQVPATAEQRELIANLASRSGQDFDRVFIREVIEDHRADIDEFEAARVSLSSDVGSFVARQLPTLREHLNMAEQLAARVGT
jgi:putative membrane protein